MVMTLKEYGDKMMEYCSVEQFQLFTQFLSEKSLVDIFENNLADRSQMAMQHAEELVANAFIWSTSSEGFPFWNILDNEWHEYLKKHENKKVQVRKRKQ